MFDKLDEQKERMKDVQIGPCVRWETYLSDAGRDACDFILTLSLFIVQ
jgi:hypothetical protein